MRQEKLNKKRLFFRRGEESNLRKTRLSKKRRREEKKIQFIKVFLINLSMTSQAMMFSNGIKTLFLYGNEHTLMRWSSYYWILFDYTRENIFFGR